MTETIKSIEDIALLNEVFDRWLRPEWNDTDPDYNSAHLTMETILHFLKHNQDVVTEIMGAFHNGGPREQEEEISAEQQERLDRNREIRLARVREWGKVIVVDDNSSSLDEKKSLTY